MFRHWLLTSTFYGTWLPGDRRGFVGRVRDARPDDLPTLVRLEHDLRARPTTRTCSVSSERRRN